MEAVAEAQAVASVGAAVSWEAKGNQVATAVGVWSAQVAKEVSAVVLEVRAVLEGARALVEALTAKAAVEKVAPSAAVTVAVATVVVLVAATVGAAPVGVKVAPPLHRSDEQSIRMLHFHRLRSRQCHRPRIRHQQGANNSREGREARTQRRSSPHSSSTPPHIQREWHRWKMG